MSTTRRSYLANLAIIAMACISLSACNRSSTTEASSDNTMKDPVNLVRYSNTFASAGMPNAAYISALAQEGVDIVINVAPHSSDGALENERQIVTAANMTYHNMPVIWDAPTQDEVERFLAFMRERPTSNVFLHCQMNMRASAFAFLHRVVNLQLPVEQAAQDMLDVWTPNETWAQLINTALRVHNIEYQVASK